MKRKLLAVFAHPDDEAFGPGGTMARYTAEGAEIHLLCATKGERNPGSDLGSDLKILKGLTPIDREKELLKSAEILGITKVEFLGFVDGRLCNAVYHQMADKIIKKINDFRPQIVLTTERLGISGHLDHIAVSLVTTYSFLKTKYPKKLYYLCLPKEARTKELNDYFIYFPEGYDQKEITTRIEYTSYFDKKVAAMMVHQSQIKDVRRILKRISSLPKVDHFILQHHRDIKVELPETNLFAGIMR